MTTANVPAAPHQRWCPGPAIPAGADRCPRCGVLQPANTAAMTHGLRSERAQLALLPGQEELRAALADRCNELLADLGGDEAAGVVLRDTANRFLRLSVLADSMEAEIERRGMLTPKGRTRASVALYLKILDRLRKHADALGIERKARPVNPLAAVRAAVAKANEK
jgi:hypothetical protein